MKQLTLNRNDRFKSSKTFLLSVFAGIMLSIVYFAACKDDKLQQKETAASGKAGAIASSQPLPGGKARFTWVTGRFVAAPGYTWARMQNLTFTAATGTVAATVWLWRSDQPKGKTIFNSHFCTMDGVSATCNTWTPTGWVNPSGQYTSWSGTYVYNTGTGQLDITWTTGQGSESWTITNPTSTLARAVAISSSYGTSHGRGYGSNAAWSTYKTITQMIPFPNYSATTSRRCQANGTCGTCTPTITTWTTSSASLPLGSYSTPSSPSPPNCMHWYDPTNPNCNPAKCNGNPHPGASGKIHHLASMNSTRSMAYEVHCACLSEASEWPCYSRNNHPFAVQQIIDDNNNLAALVAVETQNPVSGDSGYPAYNYSLFDWNNIP